MKRKQIAGPSVRQALESGRCLPLHPYLKDYLGYCFIKGALRIRIAVDRELSRFGVVAPQFGMLIILREAGPMTQVDLGSQMAIDKATMVRMIDNLEEKKFLTRATSSTDRRAKYLEITPAGRHAVRKMDAARKRAEDEALVVLNQDERAQLKRILAKLLMSSDSLK